MWESMFNRMYHHILMILIQIRIQFGYQNYDTITAVYYIFRFTHHTKLSLIQITTDQPRRCLIGCVPRQVNCPSEGLSHDHVRSEESRGEMEEQMALRRRGSWQKTMTGADRTQHGSTV